MFTVTTLFFHMSRLFHNNLTQRPRPQRWEGSIFFVRHLYACAMLIFSVFFLPFLVYVASSSLGFVHNFPTTQHDALAPRDVREAGYWIVLPVLRVPFALKRQLLSSKFNETTTCIFEI